LKGRVRTELDLYNRLTTGLFLNQNTSLTTGFPFISDNAGTIRNRGVEIMLQGDVIKNKALTLTLGANLAYNQNTVMSLGGQSEIFTDQATMNLPGYALGTFYAVRFAGVDPKTGAPLYLDKNGNVTSVYNVANAVPMKGKTYDPPWKGGVTLSLKYKRFDVSVLVSLIRGMYRMSYPYFYSHSADPNNQQYNQSADMLAVWQKVGDKSPFAGAGYTSYLTSQDIISSDYIKLRNVNISYNVPLRDKAMRYVSSLQVFANGQNLLTIMKWQGFDPEDANDIAQYEYPMPRIFTGGVKIVF